MDISRWISSTFVEYRDESHNWVFIVNIGEPVGNLNEYESTKRDKLWKSSNL